MHLNKEKDNPGLNRQGLVQVVAQSFNRQGYTGQKMIQWGRSWVNSCTIPGTKAELSKHTLSWMENKDLALSIKEWSKKAGESKVNC